MIAEDALSETTGNYEYELVTANVNPPFSSNVPFAEEGVSTWDVLFRRQMNQVHFIFT